MTELTELLLSKPNITQTTKKNYENYYKKIQNLLTKPIHEADNQLILFTIEEISNGKYQNELTYLIIPIMIKKLYKKDCNLLEERREKLVKIRDSPKQSEELKMKNETLPSYDIIKKYIKELGTKEEKIKYIVNFMIFTYGVRNKDCNVFITTRKDTKNINDNRNYFIVKNTEIEWIINDYKTRATYGQKRIIIKAKLFIQFVKSLDINTYLLSRTHEPIKESGLSNTIIRMLYETLTETDYYKINIKHLQTLPNSLSKIKELSLYRGSSLDITENSYNMDK